MLAPLAHNAASTRDFVVKAKPQRKRRRRAWPCYGYIARLMAHAPDRITTLVARFAIAAQKYLFAKATTLECLDQR